MGVFDELRYASYVAPSGAKVEFKFDELTRSVGKKHTSNEILDSNESTHQDQGLTVPKFPVEAYFIGDSYHKDADSFWDALSERIYPGAPGVLIHPRWGDIDVMPTTWTQKEGFKDGIQVAHFTVEFLKVFPAIYPQTDASSTAGALSSVDAMGSMAQEAGEGARTVNPSSIANLKGKLTAAINTVTSSLKTIANITEDAIATFEEIQSDINGLIDTVGSSFTTIVAGVQELMRLPGQIKTETLDKINGYRDMIEGLITGFDDKNETVIDNKVNNALMAELIVGFAVAAMAEAAIYTNYESRADGAAALSALQEGYEIFLEGMESVGVTGAAENMYAGNHDYLATLKDVVAQISSTLLAKSFDLKTERRRVLSAASDPITLCWEMYGTIDNDTLDFFCRTNGLTGDFFIEIPAGTEVVMYG